MTCSQFALSIQNWLGQRAFIDAHLLPPFSSFSAYLINAASANKSAISQSSSSTPAVPVAAEREVVAVDEFGLPDVPMRKLNA